MDAKGSFFEERSETHKDLFTEKDEFGIATIFPDNWNSLWEEEREYFFR